MIPLASNGQNHGHTDRGHQKGLHHQHEISRKSNQETGSEREVISNPEVDREDDRIVTIIKDDDYDHHHNNEVAENLDDYIDYSDDFEEYESDFEDDDEEEDGEDIVTGPTDQGKSRVPLM